MKFTIIVTPESTHHRVIKTIMGKYQLKEVDRTVVGGHMSEVQLALTFEGPDHCSHLYKNMYIKVPVRNGFVFYNIKVLNGFFGKNVEEFKQHLKDLDKEEFEILEF